MIITTNKRIGALHLQGKRIAKAYTEGKLVYTRKQAQPDLGELVLVCDIPSANYLLDLSPWLSAAAGDGTTDIEINWGDTSPLTRSARATATEIYTVTEREDPPIPETDDTLPPDTPALLSAAAADYPVGTTPGTGTITHTYATPGTYRISLKGSFKWGPGKQLSNQPLQQVLTAVEIPTGLSPIKETASFAFNNCKNLIYIPSALFAKENNITSLVGCFASCLKLIAIPEGLLDTCAKLTNINSIFNNCPLIQAIPANLFANCPYINLAATCFAGGSGIIEIPEELFTKCPNISELMYCFYSCYKITNKLPELWKTHPQANGINCFTGCTQAPNYAEAQAAGWAG